MDLRELNELRSLEELTAYERELSARMEELDEEYRGLPFPEETRDEYKAVKEQRAEARLRITELEARKRDIEANANAANGVERTSDTFQIGRTKKSSEKDIFDLSTVRSSVTNPEAMKEELRDRAMRAVDLAHFPHEAANREDVQGHIARMLDNIDDARGSIAHRVLATGSPTYKRAFGKYIGNQPLTGEEQRALSLTTSAGGYAVPFVLDPTIVPTSNLAVNPFRAIARVEQITVDEWRGVTSAGITAAYAAEVTEAGDNAPTLAQPTISTEKAQAFIPFSIEIGMDWNGLQTEMARLLQDSKDELEATKFATGSGSNEPYGVLTSATATVTSSTGGAFNSVDLYTLEANLPPRFRPRASMVLNRFFAQKIRQFDTQGGAQLWIDNLQLGLANQVPTPGNYGARLLGYGAYESSAMAAAVTTGSKAIIMGDFSYYVIADRVGLSVELIPHMFATANNRPSGQRGLYAYWRNGAGAIATNAFRTLQL